MSVIGAKNTPNHSLHYRQAFDSQNCSRKFGGSPANEGVFFVWKRSVKKEKRLGNDHDPFYHRPKVEKRIDHNRIVKEETILILPVYRIECFLLLTGSL